MIRLYKDLLLILIMGALYAGIEICWRGYTDISMVIVGGICAFLIGRLNEHPIFYKKKIYIQSIIGTLITIFIEFMSGVILNIWLGRNIWNYSNMYGNILGQVCLPYAFLWFILMPLVIYSDDYLRYKLFNEEKPSSVLQNYKDFIMFR